MPVNTIPYNDYHRSNSKPQSNWRCRGRQLTPITSGLSRGQAVAVDCEGIGRLTENGRELSKDDKKGLDQVAVVDENGRLLYHTFAYQPKNVTWKFHPKYLNLGVKWGDVQPENGAQPLEKVLADVKSIFDATGVVVGHAISNEFHFLRGIDFTVYELRDTQKAAVYQKYAGNSPQGPSLKTSCKAALNRDIQKKSHSAVEDTQATMEAYQLERDAIDREQAGMKFGAKPITSAVPSSAGSALSSNPNCTH